MSRLASECAPHGTGSEVKANEDVVVTVDERLQSGDCSDQSAGVEVLQGRPQANFRLTFANEILVPGIDLFRNARRGARWSVCR